MCDFQWGTMECTGHGYLWDADCDGYDPNDESSPCPQCNTGFYLAYAKEEAESTSYYSGINGFGSGIDIWLNSLKTARYWNEDAANSALINIEVVRALYDNPNNSDECHERVFDYRKGVSDV